MTLNYNDKQYLLNLSRNAIAHFFETGEQLKVDEKSLENDLFKEKRGVFVTLTIAGQLRGCIGHIEPIQELYKDVIENSLQAAFEDPRFPPLTKKELPNVKIEISILTIPQNVNYKNFQHLLSKIIPEKHGVILKKGLYQGTFLPQVWKQLPDKTTFLTHLCAKAGLQISASTCAGLPEEEWTGDNIKIQTYEVEAFSH